MEREYLNIYIDGLLGISTLEYGVARAEIIPMAADSDGLIDLLHEWLWRNELGEDSALRLKIWLGLDYSDLEDIYGFRYREVLQLIQAQRVKLLGAYSSLSPSFEPGSVQEISGVSCFMVEQSLSAWIDSEWENLSGVPKMQSHLDACSSCRARLHAYRKLNSHVLGQRPTVDPISEKEWAQQLEADRESRARARLLWIVGFVLFMAVIGLVVAVIHSRPEEMPNIYEIKAK